MSDLFWILLGIVHVAAASRVTGHALLTKEDSRGAVAWIGIAWLSPLIGSALYGAFGINRIARKAGQLSYLYRPGRPAPEPGAGPEPEVPVNVGWIAEVGRRVTGRRLTAGNALRPLATGDAAAHAMLAAIGEARESVALASYIFEDDRTGRAFANALAAAQDRGVVVRVLIDGVGGGYLSYPMVKRLRRMGVPVASFLHYWLPWRMSFLNLRNHKKLLIVDGRRAFTGGMNIADDTMAEPPRIRDTHAELAGPAVRHLMESFADDWSFTTGEILSDARWWPEPSSAGRVSARAITSGPDEDMGSLETLLGTALVEARRRIRIVTPYFLPDRHLQMALEVAALRRVEVEIVIPERTNKRLVDWAVRANLSMLAGAAYTVYLAPQPFDHSKLMTIDGALCLIGSSNWDVRSHRLNFELDLETYDAGLTAEVDRLIDDKIAVARHLDMRSLTDRPKWEQLRDAGARLFLPYL
jgi:cardiolipin synthase